MKRKIVEPTQEIKELLKLSGSNDFNKAAAAQMEIAQALRTPLREGVMAGDINVFTPDPVDPGVNIEYPLDPLVPGTEKEFVAFTVPNAGMIPNRYVEGDYVNVPTYSIGNSIDWNIKYAQQARWNIIARMLSIFESGFTKKINDDGWHTLLAAGVDRNILVYDSDAAAGQFTKRLVSLMKVIMRRNSGGNSTSINRGKLTDIYLSPEAVEDIRNWGVDQIDEITRRELFSAGDDVLTRLFQVNIHGIDELGENQEYQLYFLNDLGASLQGSDVELVVGLDLSTDDCFYQPTVGEMEVYMDESMKRARRQGYYGFFETGFAVLDGRRVLLGSL